MNYYVNRRYYYMKVGLKKAWIVMADGVRGKVRRTEEREYLYFLLFYYYEVSQWLGGTAMPQHTGSDDDVFVVNGVNDDGGG